MKKIKNIATLVLNDNQYKLLVNLLSSNIDRARIFIGDLIEMKELEHSLSDDQEKETVLRELNLLNTMEDLIFNLYEKEDEREQIKQGT